MYIYLYSYILSNLYTTHVLLSIYDMLQGILLPYNKVDIICRSILAFVTSLNSFGVFLFQLPRSSQNGGLASFTTKI